MRVLLLGVRDLHGVQVLHKGIVQLGLGPFNRRDDQRQGVQNLVANDVLALWREGRSNW